MKRLFLITIILFLISFISAVTIYSGEPITIELEKQFSYYSIVGNLTEINLDIIQNGNNVTIIPNKYTLNDSFELIFFDIEKEVINVYHSGGGGSSGSSTKYVYRNVTQFVDRNNTIEVLKEIEVEKEVDETEEISSISSYLSWIIIIGIILFIIILIYLFFNRNDDEINNTYNIERRYNNYE